VADTNDLVIGRKLARSLRDHRHGKVDCCGSVPSLPFMGLAHVEEDRPGLHQLGGSLGRHFVGIMVGVGAHAMTVSLL
jgi:hypothetical protein